jgi:starch-binding outer membrane protein, SusD/RagB family
VIIKQVVLLTGLSQLLITKSVNILPLPDPAEAMRAVQWELRLEFATEGMRFFDLRRWDNLPANLNSVPMAKTLNDFAAADLLIRANFMQGATFTEKAKYQPIPQGQLDLQPDVLEQNPGY